MSFEEHEVVALAEDWPEKSLMAGDRGTIVHVYLNGPPAYEVEFIDKKGYTIALETILEEKLRKV